MTSIWDFSIKDDRKIYKRGESTEKDLKLIQK
jgi:hypothetical protein